MLSVDRILRTFFLDPLSGGPQGGRGEDQKMRLFGQAVTDPGFFIERPPLRFIGPRCVATR